MVQRSVPILCNNFSPEAHPMTLRRDVGPHADTNVYIDGIAIMIRGLVNIPTLLSGILKSFSS